MTVPTVTVEDESQISPAPRRPLQRRLRWPAPAHTALIAVSVVYGAAVLLRTSQTMMPTWDEIVYASQVARDTPPAVYSAPRARGMPFLLAPVGIFTSSVFALRIYLTALSGVMMYVAFRPWLSVFREREGWLPYLPASAAGLFATLWMTLLYGTMAYPNLWLAFMLIGGTGLYCVAMAGHRRKILVTAGVIAAFAFASLLRPMDATAAALPLIAAPLVVRAWRYAPPVAAVAAGLATGWGLWFYEAYDRFGGPLERLRQGAEQNAGGLTWSLSKHLDSLDGPYLLCRPSELCAGAPLTSILWFLLLPGLVGLGLFVARRSPLFRYEVLAVACAASFAAPYLLLFDYANPRFLLTAYGLLAIPVGHALMWIIRRRRQEARLVAAYGVMFVLVGHLFVQQTAFELAHLRLVTISENLNAQIDYVREAGRIRPPCLVVGRGALQHAYIQGCRSHPADGRTIASAQEAIDGALSEGYDVAVVLAADDPLPPNLVGWHRHDLPGGGSYVLYLTP